MLGDSLAAQPEHETISVNRMNGSPFALFVEAIQRRIHDILLSIQVNYSSGLVLEVSTSSLRPFASPLRPLR
jgi:hypothetical protein